jgi:hypothetical protein
LNEFVKINVKDIDSSKIIILDNGEEINENNDE